MEVEVAMGPPVGNDHLSLRVEALATLRLGSMVALVREVFWRNMGQSW